MSERGRREGGAGEMELSAFISAFFETKGKDGKRKSWGRDKWVSEGTGKLYGD